MNPFQSNSDRQNRSVKNDSNTKTYSQQSHMSRRTVLKAGIAGLVGGVAGCVKRKDGSSNEEPVLVGSLQLPREQIRGPANLHLANLRSSFTVYRAQRTVNGKHVYFCELSATFEPHHGDTRPYKSDLREATVTVNATADDIELTSVDPARGEGYEVDERKESEQIGLGVTIPVPGNPGVNLSYSSTFQLDDGRVFARQVAKGSAGAYTLAWRETSTNVFEPVDFKGIATFRSEHEYEEVTLEEWQFSTSGEAEAKLCEGGVCNPLG
jgi:hypothetical protein